MSLPFSYQLKPFGVNVSVFSSMSNWEGGASKEERGRGARGQKERQCTNEKKKRGCDATVTGWVALGRTASEGNIFVFLRRA